MSDDAARFYERERYTGWTERRIAVIEAHFGAEWFDGKTILELGCGVSGIGAHFARLGAKVTVVDARAEYVNRTMDRHPEIHRGSTVDLDEAWPWPDETFDLILHIGVLYHLRAPDQSLRRACRHGTDLVVETMCLDSKRPETIRVNEKGYDQAFNGIGSRTSPVLIEKILAEGNKRFVRITEGLNGGSDVYDWTVKNTRSTKNRGFWIVRRATP